MGVFVTVTLFWINHKEKAPRYAYSHYEVLAQTKVGEKDLEILWKGKEIRNVASVKVAIWNDGREYIDKKDISNEEPITILPSGKVEVLAVQVIKRSRISLVMEADVAPATYDRDSVLTIRRSATGDSLVMRNEPEKQATQGVVVRRVGDECLEHFDGAVFHILYTGAIDTKWKVVGRIKGIPEGFREIAWRTAIRSNPLGILDKIVLGVMAGNLSMIIYRRRNTTDKRSIRAVSILTATSILTVIVFILVMMSLRNPAWIG
jgi:hypothetical protein